MSFHPFTEGGLEWGKEEEEWRGGGARRRGEGKETWGRMGPSPRLSSSDVSAFESAAPKCERSARELGCRLNHATIAQARHHGVGHLPHLVLLDVARAWGAAFERRVDDSEVGEDALEHALQRCAVDLLRGRGRLAAGAAVEVAQHNRRTETFWEICRGLQPVEHFEAAQL